MFSALSHFVFGASSIFGSQHQSDVAKGTTWRDKKLCFDLRPHDLELDKGEQLIGSFYPIEDVKGNPEGQGLLKVTNLRLIWICLKKRRVNLSIGWRTVTSTYEQASRESLFSDDSSIFVLCKYDGTKYEFVFKFARAQREGQDGEPGRMNSEIWKAAQQVQALLVDKPCLVTHLTPMFRANPFEVTLCVWQAYKHTHLFRHCRSNLTHLVNRRLERPLSGGREGGPPPLSSDIQLLPREDLVDEFSGILYQSRDSGNFSEPGLLVITSVRLVWVSNRCPELNLSMPYLRIVTIKESMYNSFQVRTYDFMAAGSNVAEFSYKNRYSGRRDFERIQKLFKRFKPNLRYGPESCEDCIKFESLMKPVGEYLDVFRLLMRDFRFAGQGLGASARNGDGPDLEKRVGGDSVVVEQMNQAGGSVEMRLRKENQDEAEDEDDVDRAEKDLNGYTSRVISYLNEQPLNMDHELIYFTDLGLAMEKPANGASINSIWKVPA